MNLDNQGLRSLGFRLSTNAVAQSSIEGRNPYQLSPNAYY